MNDRPGPCCDGDPLRAGLGDAALALAVAGFTALWHGRSVPAQELLPDHADVAGEIITAQAARGRLEIDGDGLLIGVHGLTLRATQHRFEHGGRTHHTWCAFDSIEVRFDILGLDATARTDCPACGHTVTVELRGGVPDGGDVLLWLPAPPDDHLMDEFCQRRPVRDCSRGRRCCCRCPRRAGRGGGRPPAAWCEARGRELLMAEPGPQRLGSMAGRGAPPAVR